MNNAPTVYIPTQPESDGLTLPTLLSLLAHGIVFGLLIYTYQQPTLEAAGAIETTMVSPEQLAELQGQILSNQAAAAEAAASASSAEAFASPTSNDSPDVTQSNSQSVPVFMRSDEAADDPLLMSQDQQQRLAEQSADYERDLAEWNLQAEAQANERLEQVEQRNQENTDEERKRLREFRAAQNNTPRVNRPSSTDRNIEIETGSSSSTGKTFDLSDGQSVVTGGSSASSSGPSRSAGDYKKGIADKIQRNLRAPIETQGMTARVALKLDSRGNVLSARASGGNDAVNRAAEDAALAASPLPIDLNNPAKFSDLTINVVVQ